MQQASIPTTSRAAPLRFSFPNGGRSGTSFKPEHLPSILAEGSRTGFFEVHAENYMGAGGPPHRALETLRRDHTLSIHGVCMSIGGAQPLDRAHLGRFRDLIARYQPALVSEHLAWSTHGDTFFNDLLPLPYTEGTLRSVCDHIDQVQEAIRRPILLENPSTYLVFAESTMTETDFIREVARRTGCGLLLDINNVFVSATNLGFSASQYLSEFPLLKVGEIHLAGHASQNDGAGAPLMIDSHDRPVSNEVWALFETVISEFGAVPTLIEWDSQVPVWSVLKAEAAAAQAILDRYHRMFSYGERHVA